MKNKRVCLTVAILTMLGTNTFAALPIGDNSIAEGNQAIATGINSIAVGTNAVATGDNLTGKVIKEKLAANEAKLKEIERLKQLVDTEQIDFDRKFEIYNRVESAKKKIATNNELINNTLKPNLDQASQNYNQFKPEYDAVVALMNERLVYISKLDFSLLATNPQNGLDILATELKQKSEDGFPQVNNNLDFYKQYIQNYVKAKGDLDGIIADKRAGIVNYRNLYANNHSGINTNGITLKDIGVWSYIENPHVIAKVNSNIIYEENIKDITKISSMSEIEKNNYILALDKDYNNVISTIESIPESTLFTSGVKQNIIDSYKNKIAYLKAIAESKYQQSIYESLKDTDQAGALQALQNKLSALNEADTYKAKLDDLIKSSDRYSSTYNKWYKENVTDVENSNTLTVKTLSDQYKAAIAEKQSKLDELDRLVKAADAAIKAKEKENAQLQPSQYELDEAAKAEQVKQKLEADKLALEEAKRTLELNNLKNIGLNAISVGNNSLVTGKNAIGIGTNGLITGEDSIGIGHANTISGVGSVAIGTNNSILSNNAFILGNNVNISTGMDGAIVFGNNSTVKAPIAVDGSIPDATVSFGSVGHERQLVNIAKGVVSETSTDAINGSQLFAVKQTISTKVDTNLGNITSEGETVIKNLAKGAVKVVEGENTTVTEGTEGDVKTFAVNVSNDAIKTAIQHELDKKANVDGSNVTDTNKEKWQENLGDGKAEAGNKGLVSGDTLKKALDNKANSSDLSNKADKNADNITDEDAKEWNKKLGTGTNAVGDTNLINGDTLYKTVSTKADTSLGNITSEGEKVIKNLANGVVKVVKGENTTVTEGTEGDVKTFAVNVSNDAIKTVIQPELDKKANTNASNITTDDAQKWAEKLGTGSVTEGSNLLVTGDTVYETLKTIKGNPLAVSYDSNKKDVITLQGNNGTKITNLANGVLTKDSTDAVTGSQLFTTNQQVASNTSAIQSLNGSVKEVGAMAGALAALHPLEYDEDYKLSFAAGYGSYKGSNAGAIGAFYRPNENILFNMGTTLTDNDNIVNAGISFKFGSSAQKAKKQANKDMEEMKNRMKMLEDLVNKLVDENNHLKKLSTNRKAFADVPENHWAAEAVETLHANNILEGYPDGEFKGDRNMSRYEYAQMIYKTTHELTK